MSLAPASRLGPYAIVCAIGASGMGEKYRALDTRLEQTRSAPLRLPLSCEALG
jgi:hypothetical protein